MSDTQMHRLLGMTDEEFESVQSILGRDPRPAELAMYSVMWSEHCSYKSSRSLLGRFPSKAPYVVVGPGENAGVIDLGDDWLAAFRIESHNHPSFVEPHQGAATGAGGILRDVFTMGARPIALWDQIRFGPLDQPINRYLLSGVVAGIAGYGNAVGVPTVGGELAFDECYSGNPLVNVMCLGILKKDQLVLGTAGTDGTIAVLLGNATGRDGIGGASVLASASFDEAAGAKRPSVQVGDPFEEKKLIEACLELYQKGLVVGVQDLGAAGLSCATSEPAARAGMGMDFDLSKVHVRETGMTPAEMLMSESQERMMAFVDPSKVDEVLSVASKWEIDAAVVGTVKTGGVLRVWHDDELVVELPAASLSEDAPIYRRPIARPEWLDALWSDNAEFAEPEDFGEVLRTLLDDPSIASPRWVFEQYDHMLFLNTVVGPGNDGTLLRIKDTEKALAVSTDGNGPLCYLDPLAGSSRLVYEAALNVAMVGAHPMAVVDNLNFGNPEKPEVMWQAQQTIEGISVACEELGIPVVGGNVSFYNETDGTDIHPTPIVGLVGLAEPAPSNPPRLDRIQQGMELWLIGPDGATDLVASRFAQVIHKRLSGKPTEPSPDLARAAVSTAIDIVASEISPSLHDISDGGLIIAVTEMCMASNVGIALEHSDWRTLFSEAPHRFLAAVEPGKSQMLQEITDRHGIPAKRIGLFGGESIESNGHSPFSMPVTEARKLYEDAIPRRMK